MDVRTVCLGVLTLGEASGYEIRKRFEDGPFQYFTDAGFGSIYPALNRLHQEGLISCEQKSQTNRPDKKVYSITSAGRAALVTALQRPPGPDKFRSDLLLALFFEHLVPPSLMEQAVDGRIEWYRERIAHLECCDRTDWGPGPVFVNEFGQAVYRAALKFLEENRHRLRAERGRRATPTAAE